MALLLLANGTPMIRAGDELLQSQGGNNNPFNLDGPTTWIPWERLHVERDFHRFVRLMIAFRKAHPSLCRSTFWREDVRCYGPEGALDLSVDARCLAYWLGGRSEGDTDLYVMINGGPAPVAFTLQEGPVELWRRAVDTGRAAPDDIVEPGSEQPLASARYQVGGRSVVVLLRS
jgi:glycogen operon protein